MPMLSPEHAPRMKTDGVPLIGRHPAASASRSIVVATRLDPTRRPVQCTRHLLGAPVRMRMRGFDELCTPSDGLWSPMGLA